MTAAVAVIALATAPGALAGSLPDVDSGELPGPPLLYDDPPRVPLLEDSGPFQADPLLVSGTDAYRDGEYLYQDYLFDDRGANTAPGLGPRASMDGQTFSPTAGDVFYPDDDDYANNAADLVELRVTREDDALVYRMTLNTVVDEDAAIVGIGVDTDDAQEALVEWPDNAGMESPGLDHFVTAWGDGARVTRFDTGGPPEVETLDGDDVDIDTDANQMTVRVPDDVVETPGDDEEWAYVAGTGVHDGSGEFADVVPGPGRSEQEPTSGGAPAGSNVFNLAFRFFEPQQDLPTPEYDTGPGVGNWFEDEQARKLQAGTTEPIDSGSPPATAQSGDDERDAAAVVDFGEIDGDDTLHEPTGCDDEDKGCEQARVMPSRVEEEDQFEGVDYEGFPHYGGPLQPYLLTVPPDYEDGDDAGLTFSLHSLGGSYTQFKVFSPRQLRDFGDERDDLVVTPLGHGPDGWYADEAEVDFFSAWADVARHFDLDPDEVAISGYSMGGHGTYKLAVEYPDLFGRAFTTVGPPARGSWEPPPEEQGQYPRPSSDENAEPSQDTNTHPRLENLRWIPFMNWVGAEDELVPYDGPRRQQARFDAEGLRSTLWTFVASDHFALATIDEWDEAREFLQDGDVARDPGRVNFAFFPAADRPELDLVKDHAYWVSQLRVRDGGPGAGRQFAIGCPGTPDQGTCPARGEIDARSLAFGEGDPDLRRIDRAEPGASPGPAAVEGTEWDGIDDDTRENELELELDNVGEAVVEGRRARLDGDRKLHVRIRSDGPGLVRLELPLPDGTAARLRGEGGRAEGVDVDSDGATFAVVEGERVYEIDRFGNGRGGGGSGGGDRNDRGDGSDGAALPAPSALPTAVASVECAAYVRNFGFANPAGLRRCVFAAVAVMTTGVTPEVACAQQRMSTRRRRGRRFSDARACRLAAASARTKAPLFGL